MTEYIDRHEAVVVVSRPALTRAGLRRFICQIPAADVVEVVRCKDCAVPHNHWTGCPRMNGTVMRPDDYCSYGERKEGEEVQG